MGGSSTDYLPLTHRQAGVDRERMKSKMQVERWFVNVRLLPTADHPVGGCGGVGGWGRWGWAVGVGGGGVLTSHLEEVGAGRGALSLQDTGAGQPEHPDRHQLHYKDLRDWIIDRVRSLGVLDTNQQ